MVIQTDDEIYLRGQTGAQLDGSRMVGLGRTPEDAAAQADQACRTPGVSSAKPDRAWKRCASSVSTLAIGPIGSRSTRSGRHFGDVHPCSTGLIMRGFARPDILCEIDMAVARAHGTPHQRLRRFETSQQYKDGQDLRCKFAWRYALAIVSTCGVRPGVHWTASSSAMAMPRPRQPRRCRTSRPCSRKPGAASTIYCKITIYIADRAYREPVYQVVGQALKGVFPVGTGLIVDGFASPRILVEIDVDAVVQD